MNLVFILIGVAVVVIIIAIAASGSEKRKESAHEIEMIKKYDNVMKNLSTMSSNELNELIVDLAMTEIIYENMLEKHGAQIANQRCGDERYGCRTHNEKMSLYEAALKEDKRRNKR